MWELMVSIIPLGIALAAAVSVLVLLVVQDVKLRGFRD